MRYLHTLFFTLLWLAGLAQNQQTQQLVRFPLPSGRVTGSAVRNMDLYPANFRGDNGFEEALRAGAITVTTATGTIAGTNPATGPAWLTAFAKMNGRELQILATTSLTQQITMKLDFVDGKTRALSNKDNPNLSSGTFYPYGSAGSELIEWTLRYMPTNKAVRLTFRTSGQSDFQFVFTPVTTVTTPAVLFLASGNTSPPPSTTTVSWYNVARLGYRSDRGAKDMFVYAQASDNQSYQVQLSALSGQGSPSPAGFVTMESGSYTVEGLSQTFNRRYNYQPAFAGGANINNGTFEIRVRPASATSNVVSQTFVLSGSTGGQSAIFTPPTSATITPPPANTAPQTGSFAYETPNGNWTGNSTQAIYYGIVVGNTLTQESGDLKIEFREGFGGAMQIYRKVNGQWVTTINFRDQGRLQGVCAYAGPLSFAADQPEEKWRFIGYNPLWGSVNNQSGPVLQKGITSDGYLYTKTQFASWPHAALLPLPIYVEQWAKIIGNRIDMKYRLTHFRGSPAAGALQDNTLYEAREQETPFSMIWPADRARFYNGTQPFTNAPSQSTDAVNWTISSFPVSEPWLAAELPEGKLLGLVGTDMYNANINYTNLGGEKGEAADRFMYIGGRQWSHLDPNAVIYYNYQYIYGSESEIRSAAYALPRSNVPDWTFSRANGRAGWVGVDGTQDQKEPFTAANWNPTYTGKTETIGGNTTTHASTTTLLSPFGSWRASDVPTYYIRMKFKKNASNVTRMGVRFRKIGQTFSGFDPGNAGNSAQYPAGSVDGTSQTVWFNVTSDDNFRTYAVNLASNSAYNGVIVRYEIVNDRCCGLIPPGQSLEISYMGGNNPDATSSVPPPNPTPTVTPLCISCTYPAYDKVLVVGNSLTYHPFVAGLWPYNWAMAASAADKTMLSLLTEEMKRANPNVQVRGFHNFEGDGGSVTSGTGPGWEANPSAFDLNRLNNVANWQPSLIIMALAENIPPTVSNLATHYKALIDKLKSVKTTARVILTNSVWGQTDITNLINGVAAERGYTLADGADMWNNGSYYVNKNGTAVEKHLNDAGHRERARRIAVAIATPEPTPIGSVTATSPLSLTSGFAEGTLSELMALAPFVPQFNQFSSWPYGNNIQYLERNGTKIGYLKSITQTLVHHSRSDFRGGENLINTELDSKTSTYQGDFQPLGGRSGTGWSTYGTPTGGPVNCDNLTGTDPYTENYNGVNHSTAELCDDTGWNPVPGGSANFSVSPWLWWERRTVAGYGEVIYSKTQPVQWAMQDVPGKVYVHRWDWIDDAGAHRWFFIYENFRDDNQRRYRGRNQEWPFVYPIGRLYKKTMYSGADPWTNGGLTDITSPEPTEGGNPLTNQNDTGRKFGTENWIGATQADGAGLYLWTPYNTVFRGKQFQGHFGNANTNASSYINSDVMSQGGDLNVTYAYTGATFVGSLSQFRTWLYAQPRPSNTSFGWTFANNRTAGWWSDDAPANYVNGRYRFNVGYIRNNGQPLEYNIGFGKFWSPAGAWKASAISTVYVKIKSSGLTNLTLWWKKPNQTETEGDANQMNFTVNGNGSEETIAIPVSSSGNWSGIITYIGVGNPYNNVTGARPVRQGTEWLELTYVGTTNPN